MTKGSEIQGKKLEVDGNETESDDGVWEVEYDSDDEWLKNAMEEDLGPVFGVVENEVFYRAINSLTGQYSEFTKNEELALKEELVLKIAGMLSDNLAMFEGGISKEDVLMFLNKKLAMALLDVAKNTQRDEVVKNIESIIEKSPIENDEIREVIISILLARAKEGEVESDETIKNQKLIEAKIFYLTKKNALFAKDKSQDLQDMAKSAKSHEDILCALTLISHAASENNRQALEALPLVIMSAIERLKELKRDKKDVVVIAEILEAVKAMPASDSETLNLVKIANDMAKMADEIIAKENFRKNKKYTPEEFSKIRINIILAIKNLACKSHEVVREAVLTSHGDEIVRMISDVTEFAADSKDALEIVKMMEEIASTPIWGCLVKYDVMDYLTNLVAKSDDLEIVKYSMLAISKVMKVADKEYVKSLLVKKNIIDVVIGAINRGHDKDCGAISAIQALIEIAVCDEEVKRGLLEKDFIAAAIKVIKASALNEKDNAEMSECVAPLLIKAFIINNENLVARFFSDEKSLKILIEIINDNALATKKYIKFLSNSPEIPDEQGFNQKNERERQIMFLTDALSTEICKIVEKNDEAKNQFSEKDGVRAVENIIDIIREVPKEISGVFKIYVAYLIELAIGKDPEVVDLRKAAFATKNIQEFAEEVILENESGPVKESFEKLKKLINLDHKEDLGASAAMDLGDEDRGGKRKAKQGLENPRAAKVATSRTSSPCSFKL